MQMLPEVTILGLILKEFLGEVPQTPTTQYPPPQMHAKFPDQLGAPPPP